MFRNATVENSLLCVIAMWRFFYQDIYEEKIMFGHRLYKCRGCW